MKIRENFESRFIHAEQCTILLQNGRKSQHVHCTSAAISISSDNGIASTVLNKLLESLNLLLKIFLFKFSRDGNNLSVGRFFHPAFHASANGHHTPLLLAVVLNRSKSFLPWIRKTFHYIKRYERKNSEELS